MKSARRDKILELIDTKPISTQTELADELKQCGYDVTQTTVSRDIKSLELIKALSPETGTYCYAISTKDAPAYRYQSAFGKSVMSVTCAKNIVVVKTIPGAAALVAKAIENFNDKDLLGSVAGYDTVIIVISDDTAAARVTMDINTFIQNNK